MFKILKKETLANGITKMVIDAPLIAKKAQSGQFLVLRTHDKGERFPLTIADFDREAGTVTIIFAQVGRSTKQLGALPEGGEILDVVGPLGVASHFDPVSYTHLDVYKRQVLYHILPVCKPIICFFPQKFPLNKKRR